MSFGSYSLLRPRFSARLPSCTPQTRIPQCRIPNVRHQLARCVASDASVAEPDHPPLTDTESYEAEYFHSHASASHEPHNAPTCPPIMAAASHNIPSEHQENESTDTQTSAGRRRVPIVRALENSARNSQSQSPPGHARLRTKPLLSRGLALTIIKNEGLPENLVNTSFRVFPRLERHLQRRPVNPTSIYIEARMRMTALYTRQVAVQQWKSGYSQLFSNNFHGRESEAPVLTEDEEVLLRKIQSDCLGEFRDVWKGLDRVIKAARWQALALWLLQNSPELMLQYLLVTTEGLERPLFDMIVDCFNYLDYFHYDTLQHWSNDSHTYKSALQTCLDPETWPIVSLPQDGIRLYLKRGSYETTAHAFDMMQERQTQITAEAALLFMRDFTEHSDVERALSSLWLVLKLKRPEFSLESVGVMRHCCKLLTLDSVEDGPQGRNFRILPRLLEMGVRPDRDMMNVVLSNAFKTRDSQLGYDMLEFMKGQGHELDTYTYIALLVDAVDRGDRGQVDLLQKEIEGHEKLRANPFIMSKLFHAHFSFTVKHMEHDTDPSEVFYSMLEMYNRLHDITPLKELLIVPQNYTPPPGGANTQPSVIALYVMIATFFRCQQRPSVVIRVYRQFQELVARGHETIGLLAQTDHTYNEFLIGLRDHPEGLRPSVRIVEDMLQPLVSSRDSEDETVRAIPHAKPSHRTWTILLSAFLYNKQPLAAEKVKEMMARYKVEYNDVTWNIIINGYANMQNVPMAAQSIKAMESRGYPIDSYTMKSLRYLRDPERLWVAIEELDRASEPEASPADEQMDQEFSADKEESSGLLDQRLLDLKQKMTPKI